MPSDTRLLDVIRAFSGRRVVIVGDVLADEFIYGQIERVSREAPVLILKYGSTSISPGGAGNAANNVAALGGFAQPIAMVGADEAGRRLRTAFHKRVDVRGVLQRRGAAT